VPFDFIDQTSLIGPVERVAERMRAFADAGVTTLSVSAFSPEPGPDLDSALDLDLDLEKRIRTLEQVSTALDVAGLAD
jgi:hypothetical protein